MANTRRPKKGQSNRSKYQTGGHGPKNPNTNTNKNKKFRRYGDDYPTSNEVSESTGASFNRMNDIKWYRSNEQLLNDVARIAYNIPVGLPVQRDGSMISQGDAFAIPGIALMNVVPTFGKAKTPSDPVNVAFAGMFTYIRSHTSSKFDWDDNTLAINMLATDSLYYFTKWCIRAYATLPLFHQANKYLPQALIEAQGIDYDDLLANAAKFRAELNLRIARINALKIPSELYIFARHMWMFESYYIEGDIVKDQIYMYKPAAYYVHSKDANGLSYLACHRTETGGSGTGGRLTTADLIRKIDTMLDPIFNDQYFNLISGYIEQAYEGKCMSLSYIPDQMLVPLIHSPEVLLQFKNAKPYPIRHATSGAGYYDNWFDVKQEPASATDIRVCIKTTTSLNGLKVYRELDTGLAIDVDANSTNAEKWNFYVIANEYSKPNLITSPHEDVVPAENMINTRLIPSLWASPGASAPSISSIGHDFGTEWPISVEIIDRWWDSYNSTLATLQYELHSVMLFNANAANAFVVTSRLLPMWSVFKYMPELRIVTRTSSSDTDVAPCENSFFEIDNYALVRADEVQMMHKSAIMSMLRVPENASTNLSAR